MKKLLVLVFICLIAACNKPISNTDSVYQEILKDANYKETFKNNTLTICLTTTYDNERYCSIITYDNSKNKIKDIKCIANPQTDTCEENGKEKTYDTKGNLIKERTCYKYAQNNTCIDWNHYGKDYKYDENNNMIWERQCEWVDKNGDKCMGQDTEEEYDYYHTYREGYDYTYDEQNRKISEKRCSSYYQDGSCAEFDTLIEYIYDEKGNLTARECYKNLQKSEELICPDFLTYELERYVYNSQGFLVEKYKLDDFHEKYLLDDKGNILVKQILYGRGSIATEYEYDEKNRVITERGCLGFYKNNLDLFYEVVDLREDGHCKNFENEVTYTYDKKDNIISKKYCDYERCADMACYEEDEPIREESNEANVVVVGNWYKECKLGKEEYCKKYGTITNYTYDSNKNLIKEEKKEGNNIYTTTYTEDKKNNLIRERYLKNGKYSIDPDYRSEDVNKNFGIDTYYNQKGDIVKLRYCLEVDENGSCIKIGYGQNYIYDNDGNLFMMLFVNPQGQTFFDKYSAPDAIYLPYGIKKAQDEIYEEISRKKESVKKYSTGDPSLDAELESLI